MDVYAYKGPVIRWDGLCIDVCWQAYTTAVSIKKAKANFIFQYKKAHDMPFNVGIELLGKIKIEERKEKVYD